MNFDQFSARINELWTQTKAGKLPRADRFAAIERLANEYIAATGKRPESEQLDRLATLCLYEEITDSYPDKMTRDEFPIMSDTQYARKTTGRHVRRQDSNGNYKPLKREVPLNLAKYIGADGKNYNRPKRRKLDVLEEMDIEFHRNRRDGDGN